MFPSIRHLVAAIVIYVAGLGAVICSVLSSKLLLGSTAGELDVQYTEVPSESSKYWSVNYRYQVEGHTYTGKDFVYTEPKEAEVTVFYDPKHPSISSLTTHTTDVGPTVGAIGFATVALVAFCFLPLSPRYNRGAPLAEGNVGDYAGEHLTMEGGSYSADIYVFIGFLGAAVMLSNALAGILEFMLGSITPTGVPIIAATAVCMPLLLAIYWDRWKCNSVYSSRFCSGCMNLSIFYVPIVSVVYAFHRGFLKFTGR